MPPSFDAKLNRWRNERGHFISTPPEAVGKRRVGGTWRDAATGKFTSPPFPSPRVLPFYRKETPNKWRSVKTGRIASKAQAVARNRNVERAMMIRRISEATGKSYRQVQSALKGVKNEHIRGDFKGSTGKGEFLFRLAAPAELRRQAATLDKKASPGAKLQDPGKRKEKAKALREKARAIEQAQRALGKLGFTDSPEALGRY